jgi:hypothetical protein
MRRAAHLSAAHLSAVLGLAAGLTGLAGCQATVNGPTRLPGQELDAAVGLYGPWADEFEIKGQPVYIWRRTLVKNGVPEVCELKVELGFRRTIRTASMRGVTEACQLYALRSQALSK